MRRMDTLGGDEELSQRGWGGVGEGRVLGQRRGARPLISEEIADTLPDGNGFTPGSFGDRL